MEESNPSFLLYHTEDSPSVDYYDCVYYVSEQSPVKYCRRSSPGIRLTRDKKHQGKCSSSGTQVSFEKLRQMNIKPNELFVNSVSIELADMYAAYLTVATNTSNPNNSTLCLCIRPLFFGKYCEYKSNLSTFSQQIRVGHVVKGTYPDGYHMFGKLQCYGTVQCDSGLMCLDWRDICDGKQQCMFGVDEDNCDLLEFNECEPDEYRCTNGMCIPQEYFVDGEYV
ncbi:unnamed protein product [Rotaria magnacalcarata]|nr:unnamed protein product [Rotaria magnacalcarata]CAF2215522.1 unnamed protein product [Rotaria magnacalcarata]CAF3793495.1 unnamed protein product [Rotaria magnacalcarata]CAF3803608.1 unnamed protein product [Rotaria magnacalcarata]CAF3888197.1 unnamed protein product [Rotaria magnacalcarata]